MDYKQDDNKTTVPHEECAGSKSPTLSYRTACSSHIFSSTVGCY